MVTKRKMPSPQALRAYSPLYRIMFELGYTFKDLCITLDFSYKDIKRAMKRPRDYFTLNHMIIIGDLFGLTFKEVFIIVYHHRVEEDLTWLQELERGY